MSHIRVVLADDHQLFRDGMKAMLQSSEEITVVGEAASGFGVAHCAGGTKSGYCTTGYLNASDFGHRSAPVIKERFPTVKCIMLTMHEDVQYVLRSLKQGADGYLLKEADAGELHTALRDVYAGNKYFKNKISDLIVTNLSGEPSPETLLSEREIQVVRLVAEGKITKEIAEQLYVSVRTVETHRSRIMKNSASPTLLR